MKIFLSFLQSKIQHPIAAYSFWEYYLKNGITEAGHTWLECEEVDWAEGIVLQSTAELNAWKTITWEKTVADIKKKKPTVFLSYLYPQQIDEHAITEIKKLGVFCVNFFCDHVRMYKKVPKEFEVFDLNWVPEYKAISFYEKAKLPFIHLPMPMWIAPDYRSVPTEENTQISFIGSKDIQRQLLFESLVHQSPDLMVDIYGSGWNAPEEYHSKAPSSILRKINNQFQFILKYGINAYSNKLKQIADPPPLSESLKAWIKNKPDFENYIKITRESSITIGVSRYPSFNFPLLQPDTYSRLRDIEAPMLGACYLTEWTAGLGQLYDLGKEIETYQTVEELIDKCDMLSKNPSKRLQMRSGAQKRALNEHAIPVLLKKIIKF